MSTNYPLALLACKRLLTITLIYTMHSFDLTMYQVMRERVNKQTVMNWFIFIICSFNVIFYIITKNDVQHGKNLCLYNYFDYALPTFLLTQFYCLLINPLVWYNRLVWCIVQHLECFHKKYCWCKKSCLLWKFV